MAALDLSFIDKLPPAFQLAAGLVFGAGLLAWVIPRYLTKVASPPTGDKIVLEAASIANMTPVKDIAIYLERLAIAAEAIARHAAAREERATEREEEEHESRREAKLQKEIDGLKALIDDIRRVTVPRPPPRRR